MELYRGLDEGSRGSLIRDITGRPGKKLGIHWTDNPETAEVFAQPHRFDENREPVPHPALSTMQFGTIIHGAVNPKDVVTEDSSEWNALAAKHQIYGHEAEDEVTARPGATVKVVALERKTSDPSGKERTRMVRFKPPRKMKA
jgi:hypothetical protein